MSDQLQFSHLDGIQDILPDDHTYYTFIKKVLRHRCRQSGYRRVTPPVFESIELLRKTLGEGTEIVQNQLFKLKYKKKEVALRPILTVGMARAYIEHEMKKLPQPVELYAMEQVYNKPKKNDDSCQSFQFDAMVVGESDPAIDAQVMYLAYKTLKDLGIMQCLDLEVNTVGCKQCRKQFIEDLKNFYYGKEHSLCARCKVSLEENPIRLLSCQEEDCRILARIAPKFDKVLCNECHKYQMTVLEYLDELEMPYEINSKIIGCADYYTNTVFHYVDRKTKKVVLQGGRYNDLIQQLGGSILPAVGCYASFEDLMEIMKDENITIKSKDTVDVFVAQLGTEAKKKALGLLMKLREAGVHAMGALGKGSMKEQLGLAEKFKASWTLIMGQIEVLEGIIIIRNMDAGSQEIVRYDDVIEEIIQRVGEDQLDQYSVGIEEEVYKDGEAVIGEEYQDMLEEQET